MTNRIAWLGLVVAVSSSMIALATLMVGLASAEGLHRTWSREPIITHSAFTSTSSAVYFPLIQLSLPRPYVPPENAVAVVNRNSYCVGFSIHVTLCWVVGEVINTTSSSVDSVTIEQEICDSDGAIVETHQVDTLLPAIAPNRVGSFGLYVGESVLPFRYICGTRVITWTTQNADSVLPVTILSSTRTAISDTFGIEIVQIQGVARNDTTLTLSPTVIAATIYDWQGYILDTGAYTAETPLDPGMQVPFTITLDSWPGYQQYAGKVKYYSVDAQGSAVPQGQSWAKP